LLFILSLLCAFWPEGWYGSYRVADQDGALLSVVSLSDTVSGREQALALSMHFTGEPGSLEMIMECIRSDSTDFRGWTALGAVFTETDPERAEAAFQKALSLVPGEDPVLLELIAYLRLASSDPEEAFRFASMALSADPGFIAANLTAAWALEDLDRHEDALTTLDAAIALHSRGFSLMEEKATIYDFLGMPDSAVAVLESVLESDPERVSARRLLGSILEGQGRLGHSVKAFRAILASAPDDFWTWGQLARIMERLGRLSAAREYYQEGIEANPSYAWAYHRLASLSEDSSEEIGYLESAVAADSTYGTAWTDLGLAYEDTGDLTKAADAFRRSLEINPSSWTWGELGWSLESLGLFDEAAGAYESGVALDSAYSYGWQRRGSLYRQNGEDGAAMEWFTEALIHLGEEPWILGEMGNISLEAGNFPAALDYFARAVSAEPGYGYGLLNLARLHRLAGEFDASLRNIDGYLESPTSEAEVGLVEKLFILEDSGSAALADSIGQIVAGGYYYTRYGWNAMGMGYEDDALRAANRAFTAGIESPWDWIDLGGLFEGLGKDTEARECYLNASAHAGEDIEVHREIAGYLYRSGDYEGAADRLDLALDLDSTSSVLAELGEARLFEGRIGEAEEALLAALSRDPSSVFTICYLGLVEERRGNPEGAVERYLDALRMAPGYSYAEARILYLTGGDYDRTWHSEHYSPFSWNLWTDLSFSSGNQEESALSGGASIGLNYVRGSSVKLSGSMRLEERRGERERESAYASLTHEHFFNERIYAGLSSSWDRQPLTVRPWQVSSYIAAGWKSWPADWVWLAPEVGVGLVNTRWSVGEDRTDRVTSFVSFGAWMRRPQHWLPNLWLGGSVYLPPGDARHTVSYANSELDFDLPGPLSLVLGLNLDYTRTPAVETWKKSDLDYYLRLRLGN
jgi:tetratricopeptide (TPR) repeat protein